MGQGASKGAQERPKNRKERFELVVFEEQSVQTNLPKRNPKGIQKQIPKTIRASPFPGARFGVPGHLLDYFVAVLHYFVAVLLPPAKRHPKAAQETQGHPKNMRRAAQESQRHAKRDKGGLSSVLKRN